MGGEAYGTVGTGSPTGTTGGGTWTTGTTGGSAGGGVSGAKCITARSAVAAGPVSPSSGNGTGCGGGGALAFAQVYCWWMVAGTAGGSGAGSSLEATNGIGIFGSFSPASSVSLRTDPRLNGPAPNTQVSFSVLSESISPDCHSARPVSRL